MRVVEGDYYDGKQSRRQTVQLHILGDRLSIRQQGHELKAAVGLDEVEISSRLGNTPRYLAFADGAKFETLDNEAIDALIKQHGGSRHAGFLHILESRKRYILFALVIVTVFTGWGVLYGIPMAARVAANALPATTNTWIAQGVLDILDSQYLAPTTLDEATQSRISRHFEKVVAPFAGDYELNVIFRQGKAMGANAIALPSGTIIFTDELVRLAEHDDELAAVLAHEIGHVVERHGLRRAIQSSTLGVLMVTVFGDVSTLSSLVAALPVILTEMGYSRAFEREADQFAHQLVAQVGIAPQHFASILSKLETYAACQAEADQEPAEACKGLATTDDERPAIFNYLSTHPPTQERILPFQGDKV